MRVFQIPAILDGMSPLKDGGMSLRFHTNEASNDDKVTIMEYYQKFGWLVFSEQENPDVPMEDIRRDTGGKSPSQRLRNVLYVLYKQSGKADITFEEYYAQKMEFVINRFKENLDD